MPSRSAPRQIGNVHAVAVSAAPALDPAAVVLAVTYVDSVGRPGTIQIAFPASGVQELRKNLRVALMALPIDNRQGDGS